MEFARIQAKFARHAVGALYVITGIGGMAGILLIFRDHWIEGVLLTFVSVHFYHMGVLGKRRFCCYGVARKLNALCGGDTLFDDFGGLVLGGFLTRKLLIVWLCSIAGWCVLPLLLIAIFPLSAPWTSFAVALAAARFLALLGEIYVWLVADRYRLWYAPEEHVRFALEKSKQPATAIEGIISRARAQNLLFR